VSGFAFYERTLAMHRDWELVDVLATVADASVTATVRELIDAGRGDDAADYLEKVDAPTAEAAQVVTDLIASLR
jgi:hypothetical protein